MKLLSSILFIGIILFAANCSSLEEKDKMGPVIIPIEGAEFTQINSSDLLEATDFVFLETAAASALADMVVFYHHQGEYFAYSSFQGETIKRFSATGDYLNSIGTLGKGPGEFNQSTDIMVSDGYLDVLDGSNIVKIYRYILDGTFIEQKAGEIPTYVSSFCVHPESQDYLFYTQYNAHKVIRMNQEGTKTDSLLPCSATDRMNVYFDAFFCTPEGHILMHEPAYNTIWIYEGENFRPQYQLDFGEFTFVPGEKDEERFFKTMTEKGLWTIRWALENHDYLYCCVLFQNPGAETLDQIRILHLVYDKDSNKTYQLGTGEIKEQVQGAFDLTADNVLYLVGIPVHLNDWDAWNQEVSKRDLPFDIENNPIVMKVRLDAIIR